jgi:hypothetical protein
MLVQFWCFRAKEKGCKNHAFVDPYAVSIMNRALKSMLPFEKKPTLPFHERFAAWLIVSIVVFLTVLNVLFHEAKIPESDYQHHLVNPLIEITIEGAVENPGTYQIQKGILVRQALDLAKPLPEANLSKIKLDSPINRRRVIKVPSNTLLGDDPKKKRKKVL